MTRIALLILATAHCLGAQACSVGLHLATHHMGNSYEDASPSAPTVERTKKPLRSANPGIWADCSGYTAGTYLNSVSRSTVYAGYTVRIGLVDITTGLATGYGKPQPIAVPSIGLPGGLRVAAFPAQHHRAGGIHFMWEF
jgi:hypothetical protein